MVVMGENLTIRARIQEIMAANPTLARALPEKGVRSLSFRTPNFLITENCRIVYPAPERAAFRNERWWLQIENGCDGANTVS